MSYDCYYFRYIQSFLNEPASRFMSKIVEVEIHNPCSLQTLDHSKMHIWSVNFSLVLNDIRHNYLLQIEILTNGVFDGTISITK